MSASKLENLKLLVVLWDYEPRTKEDLKCSKGDRLRVLNDSDADWYESVRERERDSGYGCLTNWILRLGGDASH